MSVPPRTDATLVKELMAPGKDYDLRKNPSLDPFIRIASLFTDGVEARGITLAAPVLPEVLKEIEGLLAAHAYKCSDKKHATTSGGGASATFQGKTDEGFRSTDYGQLALRLDPTGYLLEIDQPPPPPVLPANSKKAGGFWLGKDTRLIGPLHE